MLTILLVACGLTLVVLAVLGIPRLITSRDLRPSRVAEHGPSRPVAQAGPLVAEPSPIERQFWTAYVALSPPELAGLRAEHWVLGRRFRLDFALPERMIGIELDGHATHSSPAQIADDRHRQRMLEAAGWHIIRFGGAEVYRDAARCVREAADLAKKWS